MKRVFAGLAFAGLAASLAACVYYPNGPEGPGYGPPPSANAGPPPGAENGPPPGAENGPPPGQEPPEGYGEQGGPPPGAYGAAQPRPGQIAKMNDPQWCAAHPHRCAKLQQKFGGPQGGPPPGQAYGPPQGAPNQGPPPGQE